MLNITNSASCAGKFSWLSDGYVDRNNVYYKYFSVFHSGKIDFNSQNEKLFLGERKFFEVHTAFSARLQITPAVRK
jgi:hypothetical protein